MPIFTLIHIILLKVGGSLERSVKKAEPKVRAGEINGESPPLLGSVTWEDPASALGIWPEQGVLGFSAILVNCKSVTCDVKRKQDSGVCYVTNFTSDSSSSAAT
ncbi:hypothetical protein ILYODFUR_018710 [Ilyodon furcidens]|uniref:Uncharacterized protein n=1 Tax=Ilyodon furcidens TaxID=33524 RepID=A0ABV0UJ34_9TELE